MRLSALIGHTIAGADPDILGISADSRAIKPGWLFAALPGVKADGADFIAAAEKNGACAILAEPSARTRVGAGVSALFDPQPRARLAQLAARFAGTQPRIIAAVTGTNGKTSTVQFLRQIWERAGVHAASAGTIGVISREGEIKLSHTTPDPVEIHSILSRLAAQGVTHVALEASSHGLDQHRLHGMRVAAGAFTNLTRDHLDYHPSIQAYAEAKMRLFAEIVPPGAPAILNSDTPYTDQFAALAHARGLQVILCGQREDAHLRLSGRVAEAHGQILEIVWQGVARRIKLPLAGDFQAANALTAAALALSLGSEPEVVFGALESLTGAAGRLEQVAVSPKGAPIFVDYAHTPDAIETVLKALRPHTDKRLIIVFGCGGDRDPGKRPLMGTTARAHADLVIVTDDNPRSEDPVLIRQAILKAVPGATEIGDRAEAIDYAVGLLAQGDVLVIAGKGHEEGQIAQGVTRPFNDKHEAQKAVANRGRSS